MKIENVEISLQHRFIIAEIGVNHNGDVNLAKKMIKSAYECGADAVKFQTFISKDLVTPQASKAEYQETAENTQLEMLKKLELSKDDFKVLKDYCNSLGVIFLSSPFDLKSVDLLNELDVCAFKLGSGELTDFELINYIQKSDKPLILSTGMATLNEIKESYDIIENKENLAILHCITGYPISFNEANLNFIKVLKENFNATIGFSDHSPGCTLAIAAASLGCLIIEKHFTLDKNLLGPDHKASLNPEEFKELVESIRIIEEAMGDGVRTLSENEAEIKKIARKSIVTKSKLKKGDKITREKLTFKRPGDGISPKEIDKVTGKTVLKDLDTDHILKWSDIE